MNTLTNKELEIMKIFIMESIDCCGDFDDNGENLSYMSAADLMGCTSYNKNEIGGLISALERKGLIQDTGDSARGLQNDFVASETGCREYPELDAFINDNLL